MTTLCDPCFTNSRSTASDAEGAMLQGVQPATWTFDVPTGNPLIDDRKAACDQHVLDVLREIVAERGGFVQMRVWRESLGSVEEDRAVVLDAVKKASATIAADRAKHADSRSPSAWSDLRFAVRSAHDVGLSMEDVYGAMGPLVHDLWLASLTV